jgi:hypothetical protein
MNALEVCRCGCGVVEGRRLIFAEGQVEEGRVTA